MRGSRLSPARKASGRNLAQEVVRRLIDEDEWKEAVESLWSIATQGTKPDWVWCPNCRRKIQADRVDLRARSDALARLQEMGFGKPRPDEDDGRGMVVHRTIIAPEGVQKTTIGG